MTVDLADEMRKIVPDGAEVRKLAGGFRFLEGPVWTGSRLIFSDIPGDTLHTWDADKGAGVYRQPSHNANGNTLDAGGHLITCEHATRCVSITEPADGGARRVLADGFEHDGRRVRFNSPNDVVVHPRTGAVFFTDPPWGLPGDRRDELMEYGGSWVFRLDTGAASAVPVATDFARPNGLCFTPDLARLYVGDDQLKHVRRFEVEADGSLSGGGVFCTIDAGVPDGMRVDRDGRLYCTAGDGIHVFLPDGRRVGKIPVPETPANCRFGGEGGRTLFLTAKTSLYAIDLLVGGRD